jgi:hypothetical protein
VTTGFTWSSLQLRLTTSQDYSFQVNLARLPKVAGEKEGEVVGGKKEPKLRWSTYNARLSNDSAKQEKMQLYITLEGSRWPPLLVANNFEIQGQST